MRISDWSSDVCSSDLKHNRQLIAAIEKLEHQTRRPDILVDDTLIFAFYDQQIPADVFQTITLEKWHKGLSKEQAQSLLLTRDALMRHDAAGITTDVFPTKVEWHGVQMAVDSHRTVESRVGKEC